MDVAFVPLFSCNPKPIGEAFDDSMKMGISKLAVPSLSALDALM